jgi:hypothetical protein
MYLSLILAIFALPAFPAVEMGDAAAIQAQAVQEASSPKPAADPAFANQTDAQQNDKKRDQAPPEGSTKEQRAQAASGTSQAGAPKKRKRRGRKSTLPAVPGEPRKVVIHRGGTNEPTAQILPGITQEEAARQRQDAEQLLTAAESSLGQLAARSLGPRRQQTVVQIRQYIGVARSALKESDPQRAHTLALKAYLLSDDLVKH